jgi:ribosomal protein L16 Arg81 hydroxylase
MAKKISAKKKSPTKSGSAKKGSISSVISADWKRWIAENKMLGTADDAMIATLVNNGLPRQAAQAAVQSSGSHAYIQAGQALFEKVRKYEALMNMQTQMAIQASNYGKIFLEHDLTRDQFLDKYYSKNQPVVLTGMMKNWRALDLWTPEYLKEKFGNEIIEIQVGRNSDPIYEENSEQHKKKISFSEYIDMVANGGETNDYYMTANNHVLENESMRGLFNDIEMFPEFLRPPRHGEAFFWYGPAGTITPLHHDRQNIFMAQVKGRKLIKLIPPTHTHLVYNHRTVFSKVDCEHPDYNKYPLFKKATVLTGVLGPGQVLFLPNGWWHFVKALDFSITVTFTNFVYNNPVYAW